MTAGDVCVGLGVLLMILALAYGALTAFLGGWIPFLGIIDGAVRVTIFCLFGLAFLLIGLKLRSAEVWEE